MKKIDTSNLRRSFKKAELQLRKSGPKIAVIGGSIGTVAAGVMACKETLHLEETLDDIKLEVVKLKSSADGYTTGDLAKVYFRGAGKVVKLYAPALGMEIASLASIGCGFGAMSKREARAAAAVATYSSMLAAYRKNVIEELGEDADKRFRYGLKEVEVTTDDGNGNVETVKEVHATINAEGYSDFARFFDDGCRGWDKDPEYNLMFVRGVESWATNKLRADGYLFLNKVYEALGIPQTYAGNYVGWIYDDKDPVGDNRVIFDIFNPDKEGNRMFVNGSSNAILLDFNIDGDLIHNPALSERLSDCFPGDFLGGYAEDIRNYKYRIRG